MAESFRVLGQARPAAWTMGDLYTVPAGTQTVSSTLSICNTDTTQTTFRVTVRPAGAVEAPQHFLYHDAAIGGSVTVAVTIGITLAATDVVSVLSANGLVVFHLYGTEVTP